ncbi:MAG: hypothetical protein JWR85_3892 [Marmoricola sp.]|nr:hypothetical protein [Marmoricola sp.]
MSNPSTTTRPAPPTKHQLALMIWLAVFPTLTVINLVFGELLATLHPVLRTFVPNGGPLSFAERPRMYRTHKWTLLGPYKCPRCHDDDVLVTLRMPAVCPAVLHCGEWIAQVALRGDSLGPRRFTEGPLSASKIGGGGPS